MLGPKFSLVPCGPISGVMKVPVPYLKKVNLYMKAILISLLLSLAWSCSHQHDSHLPQQEGSFKVAVVNYQIKGGQTLPQVLEKVRLLAVKAAQARAQYLLLPELITFDLLAVEPGDEVRPGLIAIAGKETEFVQGLKQIAHTSGVILIGASTFLKTDAGFLNRAYAVWPDGRTERQDKNFPTPWEARHGVQPSKGINVIRGEHFSFAILICHDAEFPGISLELVKSRPEVIFVPSQTDDQFGLERVARTSAARAVEHQAYVFMTGTVGEKGAPWHAYLGQNFLYTPQNKYFAGMERRGRNFQQEELSVFEINLPLLRAARADKSQIDPARDFGHRQ
jgi:predicted amidohydrolase